MLVHRRDTPSIMCRYPFIYLVPVVQKVGSAIHWIAQFVSLIFIHWIVIYPVDSIIQLLNNWDLCEERRGGVKFLI